MIMHIIKPMGANTLVKVIDCVGEHALLLLPLRPLSNLLSELNRVTLTNVLSHALPTPTTASGELR